MNTVQQDAIYRMGLVDTETGGLYCGHIYQLKVEDEGIFKSRQYKTACFVVLVMTTRPGAVCVPNGLD